MNNAPLLGYEIFANRPNHEGEQILRLLPPLPGDKWFEVVTTVDASGRPRYCHPVMLRNMTHDGEELVGPRIWTVPQGMHDRIVEGILQPTEITTTTEPYYGEGMNPWLRYPYLWVRQVFWYLFPRRQTITHIQEYPVNDPIYGRDFHLIREKKGSIWTYDRSYFDEFTSPISEDPEYMRVILEYRLAQQLPLKELVSTFPPLRVHEEHIAPPSQDPPLNSIDLIATSSKDTIEQAREDAIQAVTTEKPASDLVNEPSIPVPGVPVPKGRETILANLGEQKMQVGYGFLPGTISAFCSGIHPRHSKEYIRSGALKENLAKVNEVVVGHTSNPEYEKLVYDPTMEALRDRPIKLDPKELKRVADEINRIPPVRSLIAVTDIEPVKPDFEKFYNGDVPKHTIVTLPDAAPPNYAHWIMEEQGTSATYNIYKSPNKVPVIRLLTSTTYLDYLAGHASEGDTVEFRNASGKFNEIYRLGLVSGKLVGLNFTGEYTEKTQHQDFAKRKDPKGVNLKPYEWKAIEAFIYPRKGDTYKVIRNTVGAHYPDTTCFLLPGAMIVVAGYDLTNFNEPRIVYNVNSIIHHGLTTNNIPIADCEWVPTEFKTIGDSFLAMLDGLADESREC